MDIEKAISKPEWGPNSPSICSPMQVLFKDLSVVVKFKKKKEGLVSRTILQGVSGLLEAAQVTAVMGASGAGKTTYLNVLAGQNITNAQISGTIEVNGELMTGDRMRDISAFVHQEDVILDTMTVREALVFAACLRLPGSVKRVVKVQRALEVADMLNLTKQLDNVVGSPLIKGISGGEKRRLSLGMEMITNPSILFLDEPTSGLDTYTAHKVVSILSAVAHQYGRTVIATIHQPSSDIFHLFDHLLVLADGRTMYLGAASRLVDYFGALGYVCPTYSNPADYLFMHVLNTLRPEDQALSEPTTPLSLSRATTGEGHVGDGAVPDVAMEAGLVRQTSRNARRSQDTARLGMLLHAWKDSKEAAEQQAKMEHALQTGISSTAVQHKAPISTQLSLLAQRAGRNALRNKLILQGKVGQTVFLALVVGLIYLDIGNDLRGVQDRQGSLFFLTVQSMFGSVMGVLTIFGAEKAVFKREYGSRMYGLPAYFFSRWVVELPLRIMMPVTAASIEYWMIGYQRSAENFWWFALVLVLMDNCGAALGVFISCLFNNIGVALAVMPMFILPLMVFSGFFVNTNSIPPYFKWISYLSPMRYGFIALIKNEFTGLQIHCTPQQRCPKDYSGEDVIRTMGFDELGSIQQNAGILFGLGCGFLSLAYLALWFNVRKLSR